MLNTKAKESSIKSKIKMKAYIYARVSSTTDRQSTERQVTSLSAIANNLGFEVTGIYREHISGATINRERAVLTSCLNDAVINGIDIILFSELSRCGRAIWEVLETIKFCVDKRIDLFFEKEGLRLFQDGKVNSIMAIYISCLGFCAEKERENIYFRLNQGRELAKARGVKMGRKRGSKESREHRAEKHSDVLRYLRKGVSIRDTAKLCNVGISTVQRLKKDLQLK